MRLRGEWLSVFDIYLPIDVPSQSSHPSIPSVWLTLPSSRPSSGSHMALFPEEIIFHCPQKSWPLPSGTHLLYPAVGVGQVPSRAPRGQGPGFLQPRGEALEGSTQRERRSAASAPANAQSPPPPHVPLSHKEVPSSILS